MKRISLHIPSYLPGIMLCVMTLASACRTEDYFTADLAAQHPTDNPTARCLLQLMEKQENSFLRLQEAASGKKLLYDYTSVSFTPDYGMYYVLPYRSESGAPIDGCIIYPVDENLPLQQRTLNGQLGTPLNLDSNMLNEEIPIERRFLYSTHFEEWENLGLPVEGSMTEIAHLLRKGVVEVENGRISTSKKATRSVDICMYATLEFSYRASKQDVSAGVTPGGSYEWEVTVTKDVYPILKETFDYILDIDPRGIPAHRITDDASQGKMTVAIQFSRPFLRSEVEELGCALMNIGISNLEYAGFDCYISFYIVDMGGMDSGSGSGGGGGSSGSSGGVIGGGGGHSGSSGSGGDSAAETPTHEDSLRVDFMKKYLTENIKNKIYSELGVKWDCIKLIITDSQGDGTANASYNSQTDELIVFMDRIKKRITINGWNDLDIVSILYHEYVHVKQKMIDGLVLARNGDGSIAKDEYKIYYGDRDLQAAMKDVNERTEIHCNGLSESERELYYNQQYQAIVVPVLEQIKRGEYYIVEGNKDCIASEVEAYTIQLRAFGSVMSPSMEQETLSKLDKEMQEYELIENAEKL